MRIDVIEKLILVKAGLAVVGVAGFITFCSILPPHSGVSPVCESSDKETLRWLETQRRAAGTAGVSKVVLRPGEVAYAAAPAPTPTQAAVSAAPAGVVATTDYFQATGDVPADDRIANAPWLRRVPGVSYAEPQRVSELTYRKYQSFDQAMTLAQSGGGRFVSTAEGKDAYEVSWVDDQSELATRIGLRQGDRVVSINGHPVGTGVGSAPAMFEQLRSERRFAVLIERGGSPMVLSFFVQ